jgi:thiamine-monophosphate kinase
MAEFNLIEWLGTQVSGQERSDILLGIGDDAAILSPKAGHDLVVTADTMVEGVHFLPGTSANSLGHKSLAVSLSDIAAMGAEPCWALVTLTMPSLDERWFQDFAQGLLALAREHGVSLVGGDTTQGPLAITTVVHGQLTHGAALTRAGAKVGDGIYVSGTLGGAAAGLLAKQGKLVVENTEQLIQALDCPQPQVALGAALAGIATSAIDISDGLLADLGHILRASGVGASLRAGAIPRQLGLAEDHGLSLACHGGDDYQLCFTAPAGQHSAVLALAADLGMELTRIGEVTVQTGLVILDEHGQLQEISGSGWQHFTEGE